MLVIIGYVVILACLGGGFVGGGGHMGVLVQPFEFLIILGAALGAFVAGNSMDIVKAAFKGGTATLSNSPYNKTFYLELLLSFNALTNKIRKEGLLSLEDIIDEPQIDTIFMPAVLKDHHLMEFVRDNLRLMLTGVEVAALEELTDQVLETHHEDGHGPIKAVQSVGDGLPAFGIVAAVLGVVHTMESVGIPPAELGKLIAAALVGTFLGILLAYGFVNPVASVMQQRFEMASNAYKCVQKGLLCCSKGLSPTMTVEYMRAMITENMRPDFFELEAQIKANKK
jgi:chemotaxis protein MotA